MKHIDPAVRAVLVARLREKRAAGQPVSADVRRAAAGLLVAPSTVWRWLATEPAPAAGDDVELGAPARLPRPRAQTYELTEADRDAYLDWCGNVAAIRRARLAAGEPGGAVAADPAAGVRA